MEYLYLIAGLVLLLVGGEFLVRAGVSLASHFKISSLVVGVTIVSFGTSAPELVISLKAAITGHPDIALGNAIGSNISNIGLVLALTVLITPYFVKTSKILRDWSVMIGITGLLIVFLYSGKLLSRTEGIIMVAILVSFIIWVIASSRHHLIKDKVNSPTPKFSIPVSILIVVGASMCLVLGADLLVKGASKIARSFEISERLISVSVLALGTSLPELATSAMAAIRKQNEISIGNIIGSNIFNILGILGLTAAINPIKVENKNIIEFDIWYMLAISFLLMLLILRKNGSVLRRWKGFVLVFAYIAYIYLVFR